MTAAVDADSSAASAPEWWRTAVIYQIYPRSFADASGDGIGDLAGIESRLGSLAALGVDAVWLSPFYTSPQNDAGYDVADYTDVDPLFGTLADFDRMLARAHELGLRVIVDLVPNHSSSEHPWFQAALAAGPGSPERARYLFRDGKGEHGELPPNNWMAMFGGRAWERVIEADGTPGQWYLHLFDVTQPDWDWTNPEVVEFFHGVIRFWLDRGVDGFRVDVAHALIKAAGLPDVRDPDRVDAMTQDEGEPADDPYWAQPGVHEIIRGWRRVTDEYAGDRILTGEAWVMPLTRLADWVRPDEMQQTFNFGYLETGWDPAALRTIVDQSLAAFGGVGAPSTWVLSNHDVVRHPTRLAFDPPLVGHPRPDFTQRPAAGPALRRGRAATAFMLGLPGSAYVYQGEELGLPEVLDMPDEARQDPTFFHTDGKSYGRDGCRVPIPWEAHAPGYGFSPTGESWLPQPSSWSEYARDAQEGVDGSTLEFYRAALAARRAHALGAGSVEWVEQSSGEQLAFRNGTVTVVVNMGSASAPLPVGEVLLSSSPLEGDELPADTTVWVRSA